MDINTLQPVMSSHIGEPCVCVHTHHNLASHDFLHSLASSPVCSLCFHWSGMVFLLGAALIQAQVPELRRVYGSGMLGIPGKKHYPTRPEKKKKRKKEKERNIKVKRKCIEK